MGSRYYDPNTGRFLNADEQVNPDIFGTNLFTYCSNNPVIRYDPDGSDWLDNLVNQILSSINGTTYEPSSLQQIEFASFFAGLESDIYWTSWNISLLLTDTLRSSALSDRINEIFSNGALSGLDAEITEIVNNTVRVGQWMSPSEFDDFDLTGYIPRTNVLTKGISGWYKQASIGDYYVEFNIDKSLLQPKNEELDGL